MKAPKAAVIAHKKLDTEMLKARKAEPKTRKEKASKKNSATKDPNAPKRPTTAFFLFMDDFRTSFKENFPSNKSVSTVGKAGGEKWKSMSASEKAPYIEKASKKKAEYENAMKAYKQQIVDNNNASVERSEESEKSTSENPDYAEQEASS